MMVFGGGKLVPGFERISALLGLQERMLRADWVITGEGRLDGQTLHGKGPVGVARLARELGKPVVAVAGGVEEPERVKGEFDGLAVAKPEAMPVAEAMARAEELLAAAVVREAAGWKRLLGV